MRAQKKLRYLLFALPLILTFQNCGVVGSFDTAQDSGSQSNASSSTDDTYKSATLEDLKLSCQQQQDDIGTTPIRPLTNAEYQATINSLITSTYWSLFQTKLTPFFKNLDQEIVEDTITTYIRFSSTVTDVDAERIAEYHNVAMTIADAISIVGSITSQSAFIKSFFASCYAGASTTSACLDQMINGLGLKAFRRPLNADQIKEIKTAMGTGTVEEQLGNAAYFILMSPDFIYHLEADGVLAGNILTLDQYVIAERLSYQLRGMPPDAYLLNLAATNKLSTDQEVSAAVDYILSTYQAQVKNQFWTFVKEWLAVDPVTFHLDAKMKAMQEGQFDLTNSTVSANLGAAMSQEVRDLFEYYVFTTKGNYKSLFTSEKVFAKNTDLAKIYNTAVWDGVSAPANHAAYERSGFVTTPALLINGGNFTNPFATGGKVHKHVLCREFDDALPPQNLPPVNVVDGALVSTRQNFEKLVPQGSSCFSCHSSINALGMPFQDYDVFGRHRKGFEKVYSNSGTLVGSLPVDTYGNPVLAEKQVLVRSGYDLVQQMAATTEPQACFSRQYLRFLTSRKDNVRDACVTSRMTEKMVQGNVIDAIKTLVTDKWFLKRRIQ